MADPHAATELKLYIDNDGDLYRRQTVSILKNLVTKQARGQYKHDLAVKAFGYLTEAGAKKYAKYFGAESWHALFDVETRKLAAEKLARDFETEAALGNYDHLLPKKYQGQKSGAQHARRKVSGAQHAPKKLQWKTPESIKVVWSPVNRAFFALWPGHGRIEDQNVLKTADADEMHGWLRDTYGEAYGLANRSARGSGGAIGHARKKATPSREAGRGQIRTAGRGLALSTSSGITARDIREFRGFLHNASDSQVQGIYEKERSAGRDEYAELAVAEAERRGIALDGHYSHARRKSPAQLNRDIVRVIGTRRYRS